MSDEDIEKIIKLGKPIAQKVFAARGNHSEVHLSLDELSAIIALSVGRALDLERLSKEVTKP